MSLYLSLISWSLSVGIPNEDTSTLYCIFNIWVWDVEGSGMPPKGVVGVLLSFSVIVASTIYSLNSCSEIGFNLYLLTRLVSAYVFMVALPNVVASSLFLLRLLSSFRGVFKLGGVLMLGCCVPVWPNSSYRSGCFEFSCTWDSSSVCHSMCACDSPYAWDSPGTYRKEPSSSLFSRSLSEFSTATLVLSLSTRVFSTHSNWFAYLFILGIWWWMKGVILLFCL